MRNSFDIVPRQVSCFARIGEKMQRCRISRSMPISASVRMGREVAAARIRKPLDFQPGDNLAAHVDNEQLVIEKADAVERRLPALYRRFQGCSLAAEFIPRTPGACGVAP